jgi:hypothetical protein
VAGVKKEVEEQNAGRAVCKPNLAALPWVAEPLLTQYQPPSNARSSWCGAGISAFGSYVLFYYTLSIE